MCRVDISVSGYSDITSGWNRKTGFYGVRPMMKQVLLLVVLMSTVILGGTAIGEEKISNGVHDEHVHQIVQQDAGQQNDHGDHSVEMAQDPSIGFTHIGLAVLVLCVIVTTSLFAENLWLKVAIFLSLGALTYAGVYMTGGEIGHTVLHHVYHADYLQFIFIPISTVLIAALGLFEIRAKKGAHLGWFLLIVCPIIGNFATTWALVPIGLSLMPILREMYPDRWKRIIIGVCIFSMNMLALATLAADPPQAYYAMKMALLGKPLGFFFPLQVFWPYLIVTWAVYYVALRRFGVSFGSLAELFNVVPAHWGKAAYGALIAGCVGYSVAGLVGYQITWFLGFVSIVAGLSSFFFGKHERHATMHWGIETATIFVAFFAVVTLAHVGLHYLVVPNQGMIVAVISLTLGADNAAAFAAAFPQFAQVGMVHQNWYNLHPSVTYGGLSPLGNGPQIALFLIVFVALGAVKAKEVFVIWFKEAVVFGSYLLTWTLGTSSLIELGFEPTVSIQFLIGLIAAAVCFQFMDLQRLFLDHVDDIVDSQEHDPDVTADQVDEAMNAMK